MLMLFFTPPLPLQDTADSSWHNRGPVRHRHPGTQRGRLCTPQKHQEKEGPAAVLGDRGEKVQITRRRVLQVFSAKKFISRGNGG